MNYTPEQFAKLPKWAQMEISRLTANLKHAEAQARQACGTEETNVFIQNGIDEDIPLPRNSRIVFLTKNGEIDCSHSREDDGHLKIYARGPISVEPRSTNAILLSAAR